MLPAFWAATLGTEVFGDRLPTPIPGEDEVDNRFLNGFLRIRHEIHAVHWTSLSGFHKDRAAGLWNDPAEVLMTFPSFLSRRGLLLRVRLSDSDPSHSGALLCGLQDPLELPVDRLPGC